MRPLAILVSGAPGSGKTTLARSLAEYLRIPHVERDTFLHGMEMTEGRKLDRQQSFLPYFQCLDSLIGNGMSLITDGTLYKGISEAEIKAHLIEQAYVINVHARSEKAHERFYGREKSRKGVSNDWVDAYMDHIRKITPDVSDPLDLGVEIIEVTTDDGYSPPVESIVAMIQDLYHRIRVTSTSVDVAMTE